MFFWNPWFPGPSLQTRVEDALSTAVNENDYREMLDWTADMVTADLLDTCADVEHENPVAVKACVKRWLSNLAK
jgi:hypothetical protein